MKILKSNNVSVLPGANGNAYSASKRLYERIKKTSSNVIAGSFSMTEAVEWEVPNEEKGGIIVFSEEANAIEFSDDRLINWLKQQTKTAENKSFCKKEIDSIATKYSMVGWTVGKFLDGRYPAKNGKEFGEQSLSVEIVGVPVDTLIDIATDLAREFIQETVLVKDYSGGRIMFVNRD